MLEKTASNEPRKHDRNDPDGDARMRYVLGLPPRHTAGEIVQTINEALTESNKAACKRMMTWFERIAAEDEAQS